MKTKAFSKCPAVRVVTRYRRFSLRGTRRGYAANRLRFCRERLLILSHWFQGQNRDPCGGTQIPTGPSLPRTNLRTTFTATPPMKKKRKSYRVYFASELFTAKHLIGNAYLAEAIYEKSHGRFLCVLPQNLEQRGNTAHSIRDQDIRTLLECDIGLFNYDGTELDAGTVVEFLFAKFADIPSVILRSDFRQGGDQRGDPWNLMTSFFPRTANVIVDSLGMYKAVMKHRTGTGQTDEIVRLAAQHSTADAQRMCDQIAQACVRAFERVLAVEPVMPKHLREEVYNWLALMPGLRGNDKDLRKEFEKILEQKVERDLL